MLTQSCILSFCVIVPVSALQKRSRQGTRAGFRRYLVLVDFHENVTKLHLLAHGAELVVSTQIKQIFQAKQTLSEAPSFGMFANAGARNETSGTGAHGELSLAAKARNFVEDLMWQPLTSGTPDHWRPT